MRSQLAPILSVTAHRSEAEKLRLTSDSLFAWLALPPSSFWVTLNLDQPGRIIDRRLSGTDVDALLEADLQLKKSSVGLINPKTDPGARFWRALRLNEQHFPCYPGFRIWTSPSLQSSTKPPIVST